MKRIMIIAVIAIIAVAAGWNFNQSKNEVVLTDLALANVEALANNESESDCYKCAYTWMRICEDVNYWCAGDRMYIFP